LRLPGAPSGRFSVQLSSADRPVWIVRIGHRWIGLVWRSCWLPDRCCPAAADRRVPGAVAAGVLGRIRVRLNYSFGPGTCSAWLPWDFRSPVAATTGAMEMPRRMRSTSACCPYTACTALLLLVQAGMPSGGGWRDLGDVRPGADSFVGQNTVSHGCTSVPTFDMFQAPARWMIWAELAGAAGGIGRGDWRAAGWGLY
jgi:hypothetical protein